MSSPERKCLHEMANKLTIAQGKVKRVLYGRSEESEVDLRKAEKAIDAAIQLIKELREMVIEKQEKQP